MKHNSLWGCVILFFAQYLIVFVAWNDVSLQGKNADLFQLP